MEALQLAFVKGEFQTKTRENIKSVLKYVERAAILCRLDFVPVNEIKPSHILALLEQCGKIKDRWSANSYNAYTRYISLLFSQLLQHQAVEFNPVRGIKKKKTIKNIRPVLSPEECARVDQFTKVYD
jgi:hypothetical protein